MNHGQWRIKRTELDQGIGATPRGGEGEAMMAASEECAITSLRQAQCSRKFDKTAMNGGHTREEKKRCR